MNKSFILFILIGIISISSCDGELTDWKGTPFNEINKIIQSNDVAAVYLLPDIVGIGDSGKKEIQTPSIALLESNQDIKTFCNYFVNNCRDSDHPQLMSNEHKLVIIVNKIDPMISLRTFNFNGIWYLLYDYRRDDKDKHIAFNKVCDKKFSDFLTSKVVKFQPPEGQK